MKDEKKTEGIATAEKANVSRGTVKTKLEQKTLAEASPDKDEESLEKEACKTSKNGSEMGPSEDKDDDDRASPLTLEEHESKSAKGENSTKKASKPAAPKVYKKGVWVCRVSKKDEFLNFVDYCAHEANCLELKRIAVSLSEPLE